MTVQDSTQSESLESGFDNIINSIESEMEFDDKFDMSPSNADYDVSINRQLRIFNHRKKQAANDAQLIMNRIALLQKEEERSRKKIVQTKSRVDEIISIRRDNDERFKKFVYAVNEEKKLQNDLRQRNLKFEIESRKSKLAQFEKLHKQKRNDVVVVRVENDQLNKLLLQEQERALKLKRDKNATLRKLEEESKRRREYEKFEQERKLKAEYLAKAKQEADEAAQAEQLVKMLEEKEREWIVKLQQAQYLQETTSKQMEDMLLNDLLIDSGIPLTEPAQKSVRTPSAKKTLSKTTRAVSVPSKKES